MPQTKQALATDVLRKLGVVALVDTPSAEDASYVEGQYDHKRSELVDKGWCYWPNTTRTSSEIPDAVYGAIVDIMCEAVAGHYGAKLEPEFDDYGRPVSLGTKGLRTLRQHMSKRASGEPTRAVYY